MKKILIVVVCFTGALVAASVSTGYCVDSATGIGGEMEREIFLGMTRFELTYEIGAPDRIKSDGTCYHYDTFDMSVFLNDNMQVALIYMGKNFAGTVRTNDGDTVTLDDIFSTFGEPLETKRRTYAPSGNLQTRATDETEYDIGILQQEGIPLPLEYRGQRMLYELYGRGMVMKYKYILDDDGIAFYFDENKDLYATVIYPAKGEAIEIPCDKCPPGAQTPPCDKCPDDFIKLVHFDFDRYNLNAKARTILDHAVSFLNRYPTYHVVIRGHTDAKGTVAYNQRLSERRSQVVYSYLLKKGIPKLRMSTESYSELQPVAPNTTAEGKDNPPGRALNRRSELAVKRGKPAADKDSE